MKTVPRPRALEKIGRARALLAYFRDPSASVLGKLFVLAAVVYVICPVDLVPDVPIVGWLDDLGVMGLAVTWMGHVASRYRSRSLASEMSGAGGGAEGSPSASSA